MGVVHIAGLGAGGQSSLPYGTLQLLRSGMPVLLRTERHPVVAQLRLEGIDFTSMDDCYEQAEDFDEVYEQIVERVLARADVHQGVVFAVPGHPAVAERAVRLLRERAAARGHQIVWGPGQSFLDDLLLRLEVDPVEGLLMLDAASLSVADLVPRRHTVIVQMYNRDRAAEVKEALSDVYGDEYEVTVARAVGVEGEEELVRVPVFALDRGLPIDHLTTLYVPPLVDREQRLGQWQDLVDIVARLRDPIGGCPWDLAQTHETLRKYVVEEAYEVADAIDEGDLDHLAEELGDLLLQVLLHSQIGSESGYFDVRDVIRTLSQKLIRRHPHVFGDARIHDVEGVKANWDVIKRQEQVDSGGQPAERFLQGLKRGLPPFAASVQLQVKAAEMGLDWPDLQGVLDKVREEAVEVAEALSAKEQEAEVGDLLFSAINAARHLQVDPERALVAANQRFLDRLTGVLGQIREQNVDISDVGLDVLELFWQNAKGSTPG